jgi:hypothetical protein
LHRASAAFWRRHDADRLIDKGRAPLPRSSNTGSLLVKDFAEAIGYRGGLLISDP